MPRPRLLETLTAGLNQQLTLVSAPAGYGKTTVVIQWLDSLDLPWAWLSLDEFDSDPATFLSYLLAAIRSAYPDAALNSEVLIRAPSLPSPNRLADTLLTDLAALPGPLILVLDDYHMIQTEDVHTMMTRLVQHMTAHVHLVLVTRAAPPPAPGTAARPAAARRAPRRRLVFHDRGSRPASTADVRPYDHR